MIDRRSPTDPQERYGFGRNWAKFSKVGMDDEARNKARELLLCSLRLRDLESRMFLDIGSGSGLHSLAAYQSGASEVISFDYDPHSVATTEKIRAAAGSPGNWQVRRGSVLDSGFMESLPKADIVYSWGVLHHTGHVWEALSNAFIPLKPDGVALVALYSTTCYENAALHGWPSPERWLEIKQEYNRATALGRLLMEWRYVLTWGFAHSPLRLRSVIRSLRHAMREAREYRAKRGMHYWTDIRDWLGGWPMEFTHEKDVIAFCADKCGMECLDMSTGEGCTEFVFRRKDQRSYWDDLAAQRAVHALDNCWQHEAGKAWSRSLVSLPTTTADEAVWQLFEDDVPLIQVGPDFVDTIPKFGSGRYCIVNGQLLMSASDSGDPRSNGRTYELRGPVQAV
jgi:2-polyprenyl-3-methyl-5-hydroxy-6-metoxy-1,4-benzoquinol methylase